MKNFWNRVAVAGPDECWLWQGAKDGFGYGEIKVRRKQIRTHRLSWILANGLIPSGMQVNHQCDVPACVNPAHLKLGSQAENMREKVARGRQAVGRRNGSHTCPERRPKGERVGGAKLTEDGIRFIRYWLTDGYNGQEIAEAFGITSANIHCIKHGKTWTHVV